MIFSSPALQPIKGSSKPGIILPEPSTKGTPWAEPPAKTSPSILPTKSILIWSPFSAARSTSVKRVFCLRKISSMLSTSESATSACRRSTSIVSKPATSNSGYTSKVATYSKSLSFSKVFASMEGAPAGLIFSAVKAS